MNNNNDQNDYNNNNNKNNNKKELEMLAEFDSPQGRINSLDVVGNRIWTSADNCSVFVWDSKVISLPSSYPSPSLIYLFIYLFITKRRSSVWRNWKESTRERCLEQCKLAIPVGPLLGMAKFTFTILMFVFTFYVIFL